MKREYKHKVIAITGAASGLGKALSEEYAKLGANLYLNDINSNTLNNVCEKLKK